MVPGQAILFMDITVAYQTFIISKSNMVSTLLDLSLFFEQDRHYTMWGAWLETPSYSELPLWSYFLILYHISLQKKEMLVKANFTLSMVHTNFMQFFVRFVYFHYHIVGHLPENISLRHSVKFAPGDPTSPYITDPSSNISYGKD